MRRFLIFAVAALALFSSFGSSVADAVENSGSDKEFEWLSPQGDGGVLVRRDHLPPVKVDTDRGAIVPSAHDKNSFRVVKYSKFESGAIAVSITPSDVHLELSPSLASFKPNVFLDDQLVSVSNGVAAANFSLRGKHRHEIRVEDEQDISTPSEPDKHHFDSLLVTLEAPSSTALSPTTLSLATGASSFPTATNLRYQTFIPDSSVIAPSTLCLGVPPVSSPYSVWLFDGNNRGFLPNTSNNKTLVSVNVDWQANFVTGSTQVGKTTLRGIAPFYETVYVAQADKNLMSWAAYGPVTNTITVNMHTEAANPFCPGIRPIYANVTGFVNIDGGYSFSGTFRQVPNHEFYVKSSLDSSWRTIFRADNSGFGCLTPIVDFCNVAGNWTPGTSVWYK